MNPQEVDDLAALVNDQSEAPIDWAEGYLLMRELQHISTLSVSGRRDQAMAFALGDNYTSPALVAPFPQGHFIWNHKPIVPDSSSWSTSVSHRAGPGLPIPDAEQPFALAEWAQYILYHSCPGTPNQFIGVVFDYALQVHYQSVFGFQLGRALSPTNPSAQASFMHQYVRVVAVPGRYAEHLAETMDQNTGGPLVHPPDTITLTRLDLGEHRTTDINVKDVLAILSSNHVPLAWVDLAYTYGLHYINHHYTGPAQADTIYREVDDEQLCWLGMYGVPPAIPAWDRWYAPTDENVEQVNALRMAKEKKDHFCHEDSRDWLLVGEDPHFDQLLARHEANDPRVAWCQPDAEMSDGEVEQEDTLHLATGSGDKGFGPMDETLLS
jgi:hypothetical protein